MIEFILRIAGNENALILDSFAGSGTTAHAVLRMNKQDGGHRKFILIEMGDYADRITAERVKRVISGYGKDKTITDGTGGSFSYYELGEPLLLDNDYLNEHVSIEKIREYIWYMETRQPYIKVKNGNSYYLGQNNHTHYYFYYTPKKISTLNYEFLSTISEKSDGVVIYADRCALSDAELIKLGIVFKKIPRDIARL